MDIDVRVSELDYDDLYLSEDEASYVRLVNMDINHEEGRLKGLFIMLSGLDKETFSEMMDGVSMVSNLGRTIDTAGMLTSDEVLNFLFENDRLINSNIFVTEELFVKPELRGQGLGRNALNAVPQLLQKKLKKEISVMIHHAARLSKNSELKQSDLDRIYKSYGFELIPGTEHYYYKYV